jgi:hypothetical protein
MTIEGDDGQNGGSEFNLEAVLTQAKDAGVTLMTQDAFDRRFAKERAKRDDLAIQMQALQAQHREATDQLQTFLDKGKSDEQRRAEETLKLEKRAKAYQEQAAQEAALREQAQTQLQGMRLEQQLGTVLQDKAANLHRATLVARTELQGLGLSAEGQLTYTDPATALEYTGDEAVGKVRSWWDEQIDMHRAGGSGPPAASPKPGGENRRPYSELTDEERFARRHGG